MADTISYSPNLGWLFQKEYYRDFSFRGWSEEQQERFFRKKNERLYQQVLARHTTHLTQLPEGQVDLLPLLTQYPGLLSGTGLGHETKSKGESKLGFAFDHTSGLPYLPGSSVKGALRAWFPQKVNRNKAHKLDPDGMVQRRAYIQSLLCEILETDGAGLAASCRDYLLAKGFPAPQLEQVTTDFVDLIEMELFEGQTPRYEATEEGPKVAWEAHSLYQRDLFFDAFPVDSQNPNGTFLGPDYITPHRHRSKRELDPYTDPIPILLLKILPRVVFHFAFQFRDGVLLSAAQKRQLIEQMLRLTGAGAKTNVGFGQLDEVPVPKVYEKGEEVIGQVQDIAWGDRPQMTVLIEETGLLGYMSVKSSVLEQYQPGQRYAFKVSSVDEAGAIKFLKATQPIKPLKN